MPGQGQVVFEGTERIAKKVVYYEGTDALDEGDCLCYNRDYGTASAEDEDRAYRAEKPSATNLKWFAGTVSDKSAGKTGPGLFELNVPVTNGQMVPVRTDQSCTINTTILTLVAGQYQAGGPGEGIPIALALQTVDRSSTEGTVLANLTGIGVNNAGPSDAIWSTCPWEELESDPSLGFTYFNDYMGPIDVTTGDGWVLTQVTSGDLTPGVTEAGGVLVVGSGGNASADDGVNAQLTNCMVKPAAGVKIWFEAKVKVVDAGDDQYFIGLAGVDTTLIAAGIMDDAVDKAGFFRIAASTADKISSITARTSADDATADVADLVDDTYVRLGLMIDGLTSIKFYVDGVLVETGATADNIPNAVMCLSAVAQVEQTSADADLSIDWVRIAQLGGRAA